MWVGTRPCRHFDVLSFVHLMLPLVDINLHAAFPHLLRNTNISHVIINILVNHIFEWQDMPKLEKQTAFVVKLPSIHEAYPNLRLMECVGNSRAAFRNREQVCSHVERGS